MNLKVHSKQSRRGTDGLECLLEGDNISWQLGNSAIRTQNSLLDGSSVVSRFSGVVANHVNLEVLVKQRVNAGQQYTRDANTGQNNGRDVLRSERDQSIIEVEGTVSDLLEDEIALLRLNFGHNSGGVAAKGEVV